MKYLFKLLYSSILGLSFVFFFKIYISLLSISLCWLIIVTLTLNLLNTISFIGYVGHIYSRCFEILALYILYLGILREGFYWLILIWIWVVIPISLHILYLIENWTFQIIFVATLDSEGIFEGCCYYFFVCFCVS